MKNYNNYKMRTRMLFLAMVLGLFTTLGAQAQSLCNSQGQSIFGRRVWIDRFELGTINNQSGNNNGYANFTAQSTAVTPGGSVPFTIETDNNLLFSFFSARIWIDFNDNGDFSDAGELVYSGNGNGNVSGTIQIPSTVGSADVAARVVVRRFGAPAPCGNYILGETEDYTVSISSACNVDAGSLTAINANECIKAGTAELAASVASAPVVPAGFSTLYVLTSGAGLVIEQVNTSPFFVVSAGGNYTIHTLVYNPATLDLSTVVFGVTTGFDVNGLLIQGGGSICAALDVAGAAFIVDQPDAGTLTAVSPEFCFDGSNVTIAATPNGNASVPPGYQTIYVLTQGPNLVIQQVNATPSFTVSTPDLYTIHTLVYNPATLDLSIVTPGLTTGFDVNGLLVQGGGSICASLDVTGAPVTIANPDAGTLVAVNASNCAAGSPVTLTANPSGNAVIPNNFQLIYVLTSGAGLVIEQVNAAPVFTVTTGGTYTIHTLVYNPATLDLTIVTPGVTTGFDVNGLLVQGGGTICASLDVAGAPFTIENPSAGTLTAVNSTVCFDGGSAQLTATANGNAVVPTGYQTIYVLTSGAGLVIEQVNATPDFTVTTGGTYTIHTLVYNPATLDLTIVTPGVTTGFDVNGLLVQGGGTICASLDVAGAPFTIENPSAGTLTAVNSTVCFDGGSAQLTATANGNAVVPAGYQTIYVLTSGAGLVIEQVNATPDFTVTTGGTYTIHTLVYNPATLDLTIVTPGVTTGFDVNGLLVQGGGTICASLDVAGAPFTIENPSAGTLTAVNSTVCFDGGSAQLTATANGNAVVPAGYQTIYVLTSGAGLVIEQVNATPDFTVTTGGTYTIHTLVYNPATLDLTIVTPGVTTGFDVNGLLVQGGGTICASLDVAGAPFTIENPSAGTLTAVNSTVCFDGGSAQLTATANGNAVVPAGYQTIYVLTSGAGLVIEQVNATPDFTVTTGGTYTIHTLVYNPATLDLTIVTPGVTTGFDVNGLLVQGGGTICASLDVAGAPFTIENPSAGTLTAVNSTVCFDGGSAQLTATANGNAIVPAGYQTIYVLTSGAGLVIEQVNATPDFTVTTGGTYTIHTLVYNPATLDLSIVTPGVTTGFDVNGLLVQGGGTICASLDVAGAPFTIENPFAGTLTPKVASSCSNGTPTTLEALASGTAVVPAGYQVIYVLTSGAGLVIEQVNSTPVFNVSGNGTYTIHTLVYNPATLDLSIVTPGVTTGFDVNGLLVQGGGTICASLDVAGAQFTISNPQAGTLTAAATSVCFSGSGTVVSATPNGDANVPAGYQTIYVLTSGAGLVIEQVNATPSFTVTTAGTYTIHTLVYDPATLDLTIVTPGVTTGFDVNGLLVQGGGSICGSLDVAGAPVSIANPDAGTLTASNINPCSSVISAVADGNVVVPAGYQILYVLTSGAGLVIEQVGPTPDFTVPTGGLYTIHTLVYDPATLDLSIVTPGVTTGFDVNGLLVQGGGSICASLDVAGAQFNIENPSAGTLTAASNSVCFTGGSAVISATANGNAFVPAGYQTIYVLTSGAGLVIEQVNATPSFTVTASGNYTIHTLVYDPATLDLSIVTPGVTTGFDVNGLLVQGGGTICASLDVAGAPIFVGNPSAGTISNNGLFRCLQGGTATLNATPNGNAIVPPGFSTIYVLTRGQGLVIQQVNAVPVFNVSQIGLYRIHTLVYDPATLNLGIVVPGTTTGFDVNGLLVQGGGSICASLDVTGAPYIVLGPIICSIFNLDSQVGNDISAETMEAIRPYLESGTDAVLFDINVYPNPASDVLNVTFNSNLSGTASVMIYKSVGQLVIEKALTINTGFQQSNMDVSELPSGNYLIRVSTPEGFSSKMFQVSK